MAENILEQLAAYARTRVEQAKAVRPLADIKAAALAQPKGDFAFEKALAQPGVRFICECSGLPPAKG